MRQRDASRHHRLVPAAAACPTNDRVKAAEIFTEHPRAGEGHLRASTSRSRRRRTVRRPARRSTSASRAPTTTTSSPAVGKLRDYVENELGDTVDVEDGRPAPGIDWEITIDRVEAAKYGIGVRELSPYVQLVTSGVKLGSYRPDDATDELDIRVRLPQDERTLRYRSTRSASSRRRAWSRSRTSSSARRCPRSPTSAAATASTR